MRDAGDSAPRPTQERGAEPAFPSPGAGAALTGAAFLVMVLVMAPLLAAGQSVLGLALGLVIGFGGVGTLAARRVPAPVETRLGLRGVDTATLAIVLLLVPLAFWLSELDNLAAAVFPRPDRVAEVAGAGAADETAPLSPAALRLVEVGLFAALLRPVVEEFFFRGVLQQGAVARLGRLNGVLHTTLLFTLVRTLPALGGSYAVASVASQALVEGGVLGLLRLRTGSLLPGILLEGAVNAVGLLALAWAEELPIPGLNIDEGHMSAAFLVPSAFSVALALALLARTPRDG